MSDLSNITASPAPAAPDSDGTFQGREINGNEAPGNETQGKDKREHPRYGCEGYAEVFLPLGGLLFRGRILNLSLTGCYIETALLDLERGTQVEVYFVTNQLQFRILGNITALRRKQGAGIAFVNVSPRRALQIATLVRDLAEKEARA